MTSMAGKASPMKGALTQHMQQLVAGVANIIPDTLKQIKYVNRILEEIEEEVSVKIHEDPRVAREIEELKQDFREITINCGRYMVACKSLARYSSNEHHAQSIKDDLENGSVKKLERFLVDVGDRLARCHQRLDEYDSMFKKLQEKTQRVASENASNMEVKQKNVKDLHYVSRGSGIAAGATGVLSGVGVAATAAAFVTSVAFPPSADVAVPLSIAGMVFTGIFATGTTAAAGTAIGFAIAKAFTVEELELLKKASESIFTLQQKMNESKTEVSKLEAHVKNAAECIEGSTIESKNGLKHMVINPKRYDNGELESLYDIEDKLDEIQSEMEKVLKIIDDETDD